MGRSRSWVEEEGEVFRKGTVLLGPDDLEGEYDSEELRKEVCCNIAMTILHSSVPRSPLYSSSKPWLNVLLHARLMNSEWIHCCRQLAHLYLQRLRPLSLQRYKTQLSVFPATMGQITPWNKQLSFHQDLTYLEGLRPQQPRLWVSFHPL